MIILDKLTLSNKTKAGAVASPEIRVRGKMLEGLDVQIAAAEAQANGETYIKRAHRWITDTETGERVRKEVPVRFNRWHWRDESGKVFIQLRYGNKPLELKKGKPTGEKGRLAGTRSWNSKNRDRFCPGSGSCNQRNDASGSQNRPWSMSWRGSRASLRGKCLAEDLDMNRPNDIGGNTAGPVDTSPHDPGLWQRQLSALVAALGPRARNLFRIDEFRRTREDLEPDFYRSLTYFELWTQGLKELLVEKGVLGREEIEDRMRQIAAHRKSVQR